MAYVENQEDQNKIQQDGINPQNQVNPVLSGNGGLIQPGVSGSNTSGQGQTSDAGQSGLPQTASGQFTNLQSYIKANQDQAAPLAQKVGGQISAAGSDVANELQSDQQKFKQDVTSGTANYNQNLIQGLTPEQYQSQFQYTPPATPEQQDTGGQNPPKAGISQSSQALSGTYNASAIPQAAQSASTQSGGTTTSHPGAQNALAGPGAGYRSDTGFTVDKGADLSKDWGFTTVDEGGNKTGQGGWGPDGVWRGPGSAPTGKVSSNYTIAQLPNASVGASNLSADQMAEIQKMLAGQYAGPQAGQVADYLNPASQKQANLDQLLGYTNQGAKGYGQLLQNVMGGSQYSPGQNQLDQILLQSTPEAAKVFSDIQNQYSGGQDRINQAKTDLSALVPQAQASSQNVGAQTKAGLQNALDTYLANLNTGTTETNARRSQAIDQERNMLAGISGVNWNDPHAADVYKGLTGKNYDPNSHLDFSNYGLDFSNYMSPSAEATSENVITQPQYNDISALNSLLGNNNSVVGAPKAYDPTIGFNKGGYEQAAIDKSNALRNSYDYYHNVLENPNGGTGYEFQTPYDFGSVQHAPNLENALGSTLGQLQNFKSSLDPNSLMARSPAGGYLPERIEDAEKVLNSGYSALSKENEARAKLGLPQIQGLGGSMPDNRNLGVYQRITGDISYAQQYQDLLNKASQQVMNDYNPDKIRGFFS